jgi:hypothetical protein
LFSRTASDTLIFCFRQQKKVTYKDVIRQQILEQIEGDDVGTKNADSDDDSEGPRRKKAKVNMEDLPVAEQQRLAREEFIRAAKALEDEEGDFGGVLSKRERTAEEQAAFENEYQKFLDSLAAKEKAAADKAYADQVSGSLLKNFWTQTEGLDENEKFLRECVTVLALSSLPLPRF